MLEQERSGDPESPESQSAASRRLAVLAREAPTAILLYAESGALLEQNEAARRTFGIASLAELFAEPERGAEVLAKVHAHGRMVTEAELVTLQGNVWFLVQVRALRDPVTRAFALGVSAEDLTERRSAERAKDEFISIVSHELRTPLTAIRGAVSLLVNDIVEDAAEKAELFEIAWENVQRLGRLVDDLLDVQKLRLGSVDLIFATLEVAPLVRETLELLSPTADDAGARLRLVEPAPDAMVHVDPGRLVQALSNLVSNAIKHAPPGTEVSVEIQDLRSAVRVRVRDHGPGVPAAFVARLFAPFSQADSTDTRSRAGAGLGLYIVRTLIEAHGGSVGYEAAAAGGATFFFDLPAAHASSPAAMVPSPGDAT